MGRRADADGQSWVIGPLGERLTLDMLPEPGTHRWVIRRKAELVAAVEGKLLPVNELLRRYRISPTEYESWKAAVDRHGLAGLKTARSRPQRLLAGTGPYSTTRRR